MFNALKKKIKKSSENVRFYKYVSPTSTGFVFEDNVKYLIVFVIDRYRFRCVKLERHCMVEEIIVSYDFNYEILPDFLIRCTKDDYDHEYCSSNNLSLFHEITKQQFHDDLKYRTNGKEFNIII